VKALIVVALASLLLPSVAAAQDVSEQQFEYGSSAELRGVTRIFVYTGPDLELRQNIAAHIQKALGKSVTSAEAASDAQVTLLAIPHGAYMEFIAICPGKTSRDVPRLLLQLKAAQSRLPFNRDRPSSRFAELFVREWKKANTP